MFAASASGTSDASSWRPLFNGLDLKGWDTYLAKPPKSVRYNGEQRDSRSAHAAALGVGHDPTQVFSVVMIDGQPAIRISGEIFGTLTTRESFADYHLRLEVRWGDRKWEPRVDLPRDGGLLYHANGAWGSAGAWLPSLELQIQEGDMGDFWAVNAAATATARERAKNEWIYDPTAPAKIFQQGGDIRRCIKSENAEKPSGGWNTIELVCLGDRSWHIVNGKVVLRLENGRILDGVSSSPAVAGRIQLQSEGAEHFIRRIELRPIHEPPSIVH